jgi:hypothetical protein
VVLVVEHHVHDTGAHGGAAAAAGFELVAQRNGIIDEPVKIFYERADRAAAYDKDKGLAVVAAFLFRRLA